MATNSHKAKATRKSGFFCLVVGLSGNTTGPECAAGIWRATDLQANVAAKVSFFGDEATLKLFYLALRSISRKWTMLISYFNVRSRDEITAESAHI